MKYKIYYRIKRKKSLANSIKMEFNLEAEDYLKAVDKLTRSITDYEPDVEVIIIQAFCEVYNNNETVVLPEDL
ncbi:hypothetical protein XaC1_50 [Xanthomonas phage XaC1]|nr:hypothetical protein XaC1_50 [Xanthomonas phage XaC1]